MRLASSSKWAVNIIIRKIGGVRMKGRPFSAKNSYYIEQDAISHGFRYGVQIIDEKVPGLSVADL